jgi:hypothetical protein
MEAISVQVCVILMLIVPIASFVWQFRRVQLGLSSRLRGIMIYAGWSAAPVLVSIGIFFALVGVEEFLDISLVGEGYARSLAIVGAGGFALVIFGIIVFSISVLLVKRTI